MTRVIWHKYPEEKPPKIDVYLVTVCTDDCYRFVTTGMTRPDGSFLREDDLIRAWAERPEPCNIKSEVEWHYFPDETPPKDDFYLVTRRAKRNGELFTFKDSYSNGKFDLETSTTLSTESPYEVVAWAVLPEPFV